MGRCPCTFVRVGVGSLTSRAPFGYLVGNETASAVIARAERWHRPAAPPFLLAEGVAEAAALPQLDYDYQLSGSSR